MRPIVPWLIALLGFAAAVVPAAGQMPVQSSPFSDAERGALHAEIRAYLLDHPEILQEMIQELEQKQKAAQAETDHDLVAANSTAIFDDGFSQVLGNPDGRVTMVEFLDYQCGYCRHAQPELEGLVKQDGDIRWIIKEMPILGPGSELAARAALAALITKGPEAYAGLHDLLIAEKGEITDASLDRVLAEAGLDAGAMRAAMHDPEVDRRLEATRALADKLSISGTPTFVVGQQMLRGYLPPEQMRGFVESVRASN